MDKWCCEKQEQNKNKQNPPNYDVVKPELKTEMSVWFNQDKSWGNGLEQVARESLKGEWLFVKAGAPKWIWELPMAKCSESSSKNKTKQPPAFEFSKPLMLVLNWKVYKGGRIILNIYGGGQKCPLKVRYDPWCDAMTTDSSLHLRPSHAMQAELLTALSGWPCVLKSVVFSVYGGIG